jgi:hypothetical protein
VTEMVGPESTCSIDGCDEPAVVTPRAASAHDVKEAPTGELVPLCARHAEQAETPEAPSAAS